MKPNLNKNPILFREYSQGGARAGQPTEGGGYTFAGSRLFTRRKPNGSAEIDKLLLEYPDGVTLESIAARLSDRSQRTDIQGHLNTLHGNNKRAGLASLIICDSSQVRLSPYGRAVALGERRDDLDQATALEQYGQ
jgi:hypothetical protein